MINVFIRKIFFFPSEVRHVFYRRFYRICFRLRGIHYGKRMRVFDSMYIKGRGQICIGDNFTFVSGGINPLNRNIKGCIYTKQPQAKIIIGNNVGVSSSVIWCNNSIHIGNNVLVGANCIIIDDDAHPIDFLNRRLRVGGGNSAPIVIEDDVWIGMNCIILKGITIGARSIIGAGSVVTKSIPSDVVAAGNPCQIIRHINVENK